LKWQLTILPPQDYSKNAYGYIRAVFSDKEVAIKCCYRNSFCFFVSGIECRATENGITNNCWDFENTHSIQG
jgi:hypothetical protein